MIDTALDLFRLAFVGLVAGLFSSVIANRDYRHRKWWEMRVAAYQNAIEALSDLVYYYDTQFTAQIEYRELSPEIEEKLNKHWEQAFQKVRKLADSGAFLFSEGANEVLRELIDYEVGSESYVDYLDSRLAACRKCLARLVECSKVDLKLKAGWLERWS